MALHYLNQRLFKRMYIKFPSHSDAKWYQVARVIGINLIEEPEALLSKGKLHRFATIPGVERKSSFLLLRLLQEGDQLGLVALQQLEQIRCKTSGRSIITQPTTFYP
ncbi:MAG TPA: hypothetical protein VGD69_12110 [Herpetosiphonaceae bacterium]